MTTVSSLRMSQLYVSRPSNNNFTYTKQPLDSSSRATCFGHERVPSGGNKHEKFRRYACYLTACRNGSVVF